MFKSQLHIGSREYVSFPDAGIEKVPAKVDTGADSSAIWATDIKEEAGSLSFTLFGPTSKYYTGKPMITRQYKITRVRNSFGEKEVRFKVKMPVRIGGRRINVEFGLADRSRNRYPILIGKRTLKGKFIVDVAQDNTRAEDATSRVLILNDRYSRSVEGSILAMNDQIQGLSVDFTTYDSLIFEFGGDEAIDVTDMRTGKRLSEYDLLYLKTYYKEPEVAAAIAEYSHLKGITFIDSEVATYHALTKLSQYARLSRIGLPIPKSISVDDELLPGQFERFSGNLGMPFVLKATGVDNNRYNHLIRNESDFKKVSDEATVEKVRYVGQQYIENDGEYQMTVLGQEVRLAVWHRRRDDSTHLNHRSSGAQAQFVNVSEVPSSVKALAVSAALAMGCEIASVDMMQSQKTGEWVILEVNNSPQMASGDYAEEKIRELGTYLKYYAEQKRRHV